MKTEKPVTVLLVEDEIEECKKFQNYLRNREDIKLIGVANSTVKAMEYIKTYLPDGIILDLELNNGKGSGLEILENLKKLKLKIKPIIVITTNISSKSVYTYAHKNGADLIFHKLKEDYSPELVINNILLLKDTIVSVYNYENTDVEDGKTLAEYRDRISERINRELDLVGISSHLVGRKYIHDAILYIIENENNDENVFLHLAKKYKKGNSTIGRSIQTAIEHAWRRSSIEDLQKYYTATVNYNTGVPTPTELIYYYIDKIKKDM